MSKPLVVITRSEVNSVRLSKKLDHKNIENLILPMVEHVPLERSLIDSLAVSKIEENYYQWLIFTSANGIRYLRKFCELLPKSLIAVQGEKTGQALLEEYQRQADYIAPAKTTLLAFLGELKEIIRSHAAVLILGPVDYRKEAIDTLLERDIELDYLALYRTLPLQIREKDFAKLVGRKLVFTFFSPSAVRSAVQNFKEFPDILHSAEIVTIGQITAEEVKKNSLPLTAIADDHSEESVFSKIVELLKSKEP